MMDNDQREQLAALCHEQWAGWMRYLFGECVLGDYGEMSIPRESVERWTRQMNETYAELSEDEKDSDRKEADKFIELLGL